MEQKADTAETRKAAERPEGEGKLGLEGGLFQGCFGCGPTNSIGLKLAFERDGDSVVGRIVLGEDYAGYREFAHGGVVATLLDEAMGWAMLHVAGRHGVTRTLNVTYRRPVAIGKPLVVRGRVVESGTTTAKLESTLEDARGRLLASGRGDWVVVRNERAAAHND